MERIVEYEHAGKHMRTFVVGALRSRSEGFKPFFREVGGTKLTRTDDQVVSTEEVALQRAQGMLDKEMSGQEYQRITDKGEGP